MKKFYKIALTTLTTALISFSAIATPPSHFNQRHPAHAPKPQMQWQHQQYAQHRHPANQHMALHRSAPQQYKWQTQHKLPHIYQNSRYKVSAYQRHQLSKPGRNQAWYKVDGYYLLTDVLNHNIIKVVRS